MLTARRCILCDAQAVVFLTDRPDYEHGVPTQLTYFRCRRCELVFASPVPSELLAGFYSTYYTHMPTAKQSSRRVLWALLQQLSAKPDRNLSFASLSVPQTARILDYGCGSGLFLRSLVERGYTHLSAYDFDPEAVAHLRDVRIFDDPSKIEGEIFDVITLNHVIEHLEDPVGTVSRLLSTLSAEGFLYIRTPNTASLLAKTMKGAWRGWETPRHLFVFNSANLRMTLERGGGAVTSLATSNDLYPTMMAASFSNLLGRSAGRWASRICYVPASWIARVAHVFRADSGEELVAVVTKGSTAHESARI